jgi:hypothetical protein
MKHAGEQALNLLEDLLEVIRHETALTEKKRGAFYRGSAAFLHFHEDPAGLFADLKIGGDWQRYAVNTAAERKALLRRVSAVNQVEARRPSNRRDRG